MSPTYAIVESGGKQYRVAKGETLLVDRLHEDQGAKVSLRAVFFRGAGEVVVLDGAELEKVKVEAVISEHLRGEKIKVFKYKAKKGYRRRAGHRSELTKLEVTNVSMLARKPAATKTAAKPAETKTAATKPPAKRGAEAAPKPASAKTPARKAPAKTTTKKAPDGA